MYVGYSSEGFIRHSISVSETYRSRSLGILFFLMTYSFNMPIWRVWAEADYQITQNLRSRFSSRDYQDATRLLMGVHRSTRLSLVWQSCWTNSSFKTIVRPFKTQPHTRYQMNTMYPAWTPLQCKIYSKVNQTHAHSRWLWSLHLPKLFRCCWGRRRELREYHKYRNIRHLSQSSEVRWLSCVVSRSRNNLQH